MMVLDRDYTYAIPIETIFKRDHFKTEYLLRNTYSNIALTDSMDIPNSIISPWYL